VQNEMERRDYYYYSLVEVLRFPLFDPAGDAESANIACVEAKMLLNPHPFYVKISFADS